MSQARSSDALIVKSLLALNATRRYLEGCNRAMGTPKYAALQALLASSSAVGTVAVHRSASRIFSILFPRFNFAQSAVSQAFTETDLSRDLSRSPQAKVTENRST